MTNKAYITHDNTHNKNVVNGLYVDQLSANTAASGNYKVYAEFGGYDIPEAVQVGHATYNVTANTVDPINHDDITDIGKLHSETGDTISRLNYYQKLVDDYSQYYSPSTIQTANEWLLGFRKGLEYIGLSSHYIHSDKITFYQNSRELPFGYSSIESWLDAIEGGTFTVDSDNVQYKFIADPSNGDAVTQTSAHFVSNTASTLVADVNFSVDKLRTNSFISREIDPTKLRVPSGIYAFSEEEDVMARIPRNVINFQHSSDPVPIDDVLHVSAFSIDPTDVSYSAAYNDFFFLGHSYSGSTATGTHLYVSSVNNSGVISQPAQTFQYPTSWQGKQIAFDIWEANISGNLRDTAYFVVPETGGIALYYQQLIQSPTSTPYSGSAQPLQWGNRYDGVQHPVGACRHRGENSIYVLEGHASSKRLLKLDLFPQAVTVLNTDVQLDSPYGLTISEDGNYFILTNIYRDPTLGATHNVWTTDFYYIPIASPTDHPEPIGQSYRGPTDRFGNVLGFGNMVGLTTVFHSYPSIDRRG